MQYFKGLSSFLLDKIRNSCTWLSNRS